MSTPKHVRSPVPLPEVGARLRRFTRTSGPALLALACAAAPSVTLHQLRSAVVYNGDDAGGLFNTTVTALRLNAQKTLQAALESDPTPPSAPSNFRLNSQTGRRVELRWAESGDDGTAGRASVDEITFTDSATGEQTRLAFARTATSGTDRGIFLSIPHGHTAGQLTLRAFDNVGNASPAQSVAVGVDADLADPYVVSLSPNAPLTAQGSGTALGVRGDDRIFESVTLPFPFLFYGSATTTVAVQTPAAGGPLVHRFPAASVTKLQFTLA